MDAGACRTADLRWYAPSDEGDRARLEAWCAGVGSPVMHAAASRDHSDETSAVQLEDVIFVSWNVHVGNGDIHAFVNDLRSGKFTAGKPVRHFALLLQEAVRARGVPPYENRASGARRISARSSHAIDIVDISRDLGLALMYVPSMRNGDSAREPAADRGSAILSTLPLSDPTAIELPGERQRRVAIFAKLALPQGGAVPLSVGVLHLDALGAANRLWVFATPFMRELQVESMAELLPDANVVLGADLNTWHGSGEPARRRLAKIFSTPVTEIREREGRRVLDYLFFRIAGAKTAEYDVAASAYGSDHRPLIGRILP